MSYTSATMSKTAVIMTGGKQYIVRENDVLSIEKLTKDEGEKVSFDEVLLVDDGSKATVGTPFISGASVSAEVVENGLGKKKLVSRYRAKSRSLVRRGHRQPFTKIKITGIK